MRSAWIRRHARRSLISWADTRRATASRLAAGVRIFCHEVFQRGVVEHRVGQKPLQLGVLVLNLLEPLGLGHLHPAKLRLPTVEGRRADPVLAAHLSGRKPRLLLAQHPNDLLFCEPRSLHGPVLSSGRTLASRGGNLGGRSSRSPPHNRHRRTGRRLQGATLTPETRRKDLSA